MSMRDEGRLKSWLAAASGAAIALCPAGYAAGAVSAARITCAGHPATIVGTSGNDTLVGTRGPDVIAALGGYDTVDGRGGDDVICGGFGADRLTGGKGNDKLYGGPGGLKDDRSGRYLDNDWLRGGPGDDLLRGGRDPRHLPAPLPDIVDYSNAARGLHVDLAGGTARGQGHDTLSHQAWYVVGSRYDDVLFGSRYGDHLAGRRGTDVLEGRAGPDVLTADDDVDPGDTEPDVLRGQRGDDYLSTASGPDVQYGGPGDDQLSDWGRSGADRIHGGGGDDWITDRIAREDGQVLRGGPGSNRVDLVVPSPDGSAPVSGVLDLRAGRATVAWSPPVVVETTRFTSVHLPNGPWTAYGTDADEFFWSTIIGPRTIFAGGGDDYLGGSDDDDLLDGGPGHDRAEPAGGHDTCVEIEEFVYSACEQTG
jgi:Ca2+-binding RTX toxin-like protein